jgi:hypothetical protein
VLLALLARTATAHRQVTYHVVADLSTIAATVPLGGLVEGRDGACYGTTAQGGTGGCGTISIVATSMARIMDGRTR